MNEFVTVESRSGFVRVQSWSWYDSVKSTEWVCYCLRIRIRVCILFRVCNGFFTV